MTNAYHSESSRQRVLASEYDPFFKVASGLDVADEADGNVESPSGWFALIDMSTPALRRDVVQAVDDLVPDYPFGDKPDCGVYVTTTNNSGIIWVYEFDTRREAEDFYEPFVAVFNEWSYDGDSNEEEVAP